MKTFLFLFAVFAGKVFRDNLPDLNYKSIRQVLLNSNPLTVAARSTQVLASGLIFVVINLVENFGPAALAEPDVVNFSAKIIAYVAFTEAVYRIFQFIIDQMFQIPVKL